jgi:hypothetical protein
LSFSWEYYGLDLDAYNTDELTAGRRRSALKLLGKALRLAIMRLRRNLRPRLSEWILTQIAGKQTHKGYYKISPHKSVYVPENC